MFVYLVTNKVNGKQYVGQTSQDLKKRWRAHRCTVNKKSYLAGAIRKYGFDNFEMVPLVQVANKWEMDLYERGMIRALNTKVPNGYNLTDGGEGSLGRNQTEETRQAISKSLLGRPGRPNIFKGIPRTEEIRRKISESHNGVPLSEDHRKSLCKAARARVHTADEISNLHIIRTLESTRRGGRVATHNRWHIGRNIINLNCPLCERNNK